jgi:NhaP-type Na+/H+ or K+/H+ antiporter
MGQAEIVVVGLLVAVVGLSALARRLALPYPFVLVLGGALLGFVPGLPEVRLDPEVVLLVFLSPRPSGSAAPLSTATQGRRRLRPCWSLTGVPAVMSASWQNRPKLSAWGCAS